MRILDEFNILIGEFFGTGFSFNLTAEQSGVVYFFQPRRVAKLALAICTPNYQSVGCRDRA
jgi:hypothetical protein